MRVRDLQRKNKKPFNSFENFRFSLLLLCFQSLVMPLNLFIYLPRISRCYIWCILPSLLLAIVFEFGPVIVKVL